MSGSIVGVLLAAGRGIRFGSDKLLHPLPDGTPMAVAAAANLVAACDRVIAVVRPGSDELAELLHAMGCDIVICPSADAGMGHSLATGVTASPDGSGWVVALADMPYITPASHRTIVASLRNGALLTAVNIRVSAYIRSALPGIGSINSRPSLATMAGNRFCKRTPSNCFTAQWTIPA